MAYANIRSGLWHPFRVLVERGQETQGFAGSTPGLSYFAPSAQFFIHEPVRAAQSLLRNYVVTNKRSGWCLLNT